MIPWIIFSVFHITTALPVALDESVCGQSLHDDDHWDTLQGRIVGGQETLPNEWPWQISLKMTQGLFTVPHYCGGVLIHPSFFLTAAHCIKNNRFKEPDVSVWTVRLGKHNISSWEESEVNNTVSAISYYHLYTHEKYDYDIALVKMTEPIEFSDKVKPACLPTPVMTFKDADCVSTGWGRMEYENYTIPETLREVDLSVTTRDRCNKHYREHNITIQPWHFCVGVSVGGKGSCIGDSGGPVNCLHDGKWYVAGLTSFGERCAAPDYPDVSARVSYFYNWILTQMDILSQ